MRSCNEEVPHAIIFALMDQSASELGEPLIQLLPLHFHLLYAHTIYIYAKKKKKNQMNTEQSNIIYNLYIYIQNYKI